MWTKHDIPEPQNRNPPAIDGSLFKHQVLICTGLKVQMDGKQSHSRLQRPDMQVMDLRHPFNLHVNWI
jgi:hypothetical protein